MTEQYTPTTEEVLRSYSLPSAVTNPQRTDETFGKYLSRISIEGHQDQVRSEEAARRWLAAHDAQVRAEAVRTALGEAVLMQAGADGVTVYDDREHYDRGRPKPLPIRDWLNTRADRIEKEGPLNA